VILEPRLGLILQMLVLFSKYFDPALTFVCFVYRMVRMYLTAHKGIALYPHIRIHSPSNSSSFDSDLDQNRS
jgi:hypothetical protein